MIIIKNKDEIARLREANRIIAELFEHIRTMIQPGITTMELDQEAELFIRARNARPAFKGYQGFPGTLCTSINEEVVHGIPGSRKLKNGDIISLDVGAIRDGFCSDACRTFAVGKISKQAEKLMDVTRKSRDAGIAQAVPGGHIGDIGAAVQKIVESSGFSVVRDFVGHGIGRDIHEDPQIPNFGTRGAGPEIREGMVFAIEPMVNQGTWKVKVLKDGWTTVTADGKLSAHFENSIAVTTEGPVVLTAL